MPLGLASAILELPPMEILLLTYCSRPWDGCGLHGNAVADQFFDSIDTNGDGHISKKEWDEAMDGTNRRRVSLINYKGGLGRIWGAKIEQKQ